MESDDEWRWGYEEGNIVSRRQLVWFLENISKGYGHLFSGIDFSKYNPQQKRPKLDETDLGWGSQPSYISWYIRNGFPLELNVSETGIIYGPKIFQEVYAEENSNLRKYAFEINNKNNTKKMKLEFIYEPSEFKTSFAHWPNKRTIEKLARSYQESNSDKN